MSPKILVFAEEYLIDLIVMFLDQDRYHIETTTSPREALHLLQQDAFDLLILNDYRLDGKSGDEFLLQVRKTIPNCQTRSIMIEPQDGRHGFVPEPVLPDQAHAYLIAPFPPNWLVETVERLTAPTP